MEIKQTDNPLEIIFFSSFSTHEWNLSHVSHRDALTHFLLPVYLYIQSYKQCKSATREQTGAASVSRHTCVVIHISSLSVSICSIFFHHLMYIFSSFAFLHSKKEMWININKYESSLKVMYFWLLKRFRYEILLKILMWISN